MALNVLIASLHVLGFSLYIGGLFFMEAVLAPAQAAIAPAQASVISRKAGDRQALVAWSSLALIVVTGVLRLARAQMLDTSGTFFLSPGIASSSYGRTVFALFGLWCALVVLGLVMTFVLRPILVAKIPPTLSNDEQQRRQQRMMAAARWMGIVMRIDLAVVLAAAVFGVSLGYGGIL